MSLSLRPTLALPALVVLAATASAGGSLTLRHRFHFHEGDSDIAKFVDHHTPCR